MKSDQELINEKPYTMRPHTYFHGFGRSFFSTRYSIYCRETCIMRSLTEEKAHDLVENMNIAYRLGVLHVLTEQMKSS